MTITKLRLISLNCSYLHPLYIFYTLGNLKWNKNYRKKYYTIIIMNNEIFSVIQIKTENFKIIDNR